MHECVIINLCKEILLAYSANKVGEGLLKMRGCCIWGQRSESHVDSCSLKTVLDIMQDEGSLDSSHGHHTRLLSGEAEGTGGFTSLCPLQRTGVKVNFTLSSLQGCFSWSVYLLCVCRGGGYWCKL